MSTDLVNMTMAHTATHTARGSSCLSSTKDATPTHITSVAASSLPVVFAAQNESCSPCGCVATSPCHFCSAALLPATEWDVAHAHDQPGPVSRGNNVSGEADILQVNDPFDAWSTPTPTEIRSFEPDEVGSSLAPLPPPPPLPPSLAALLSATCDDHDTLQRPALDAPVSSSCAYIPSYGHPTGFHPSPHQVTGIDQRDLASTAGEGWTPLPSIVSYQQPTAAYPAPHWPPKRMAQGQYEQPATVNFLWTPSSSLTSSSSYGLSGERRELVESGGEYESMYSNSNNHYNPQDGNGWYNMDNAFSSHDSPDWEDQWGPEQYLQQNDPNHVYSINTQEDDKQPFRSQDSTPTASRSPLPARDLDRQASTAVQLDQQIDLSESRIESASTCDLDVKFQDMAISNGMSDSAEQHTCVQYDGAMQKPGIPTVASALAGETMQGTSVENGAHGGNSTQSIRNRPAPSLRRPHIVPHSPVLRSEPISKPLYLVHDTLPSMSCYANANGRLVPLISRALCNMNRRDVERECIAQAARETSNLVLFSL
ncbi:hypothetical protein L227DRAFT_568777 [Lentinus tigrinus ALCF2SS1-6]|uniref:Uncharacterized protein n=1 Tax=Lentinus tigrinus ALCF2SS1-6 TaxID=1328759 RepID=A0A5C2RPL4_9APHY|nr:hypothetical protein L227DRAFT_568777 [Lentinus tigrinus ALCF2SS1-6]